VDDPTALAIADFSPRSGDARAALLWPPTRLDVARLVAGLRAASGRARPRVLEAGAGSGLLARLLAEACDVDAVDPGDAGFASRRVGRFFPVRSARVEDVAAPYDAVVVSWMEAGVDCRAGVKRLAPVIAQAFDLGGGCGVKGATSYARFGFVDAAAWTGPSFETVDRALRERGRGLPPPPPMNAIEIVVRDIALAPRVAEAVRAAKPRGAPYAWEPALEALRLGPGPVLASAPVERVRN